jgi:uncharacterized protein (DUF2345 family)
VVAGQDINHLSARNWALAAKDGIVLYSYGKASNGQKPSQQTGIALHAASGSVVQQSQQGATRIAADQAVDVTSTHASIKAGSPQKILLTAGGAGFSISGGNITLTAPGNITFKAAMKNLTGGAGAGDSIKLSKASDLFDEQFVMIDQTTQQPLAGAPYRIENAKGKLVASGITDAQGRTTRVTTSTSEKLFVHWGS